MVALVLFILPWLVRYHSGFTQLCLKSSIRTKPVVGCLGCSCGEVCFFFKAKLNFGLNKSFFYIIVFVVFYYALYFDTYFYYV